MIKLLVGTGLATCYLPRPLGWCGVSLVVSDLAGHTPSDFPASYQKIERGVASDTALKMGGVSLVGEKLTSASQKP